MRVWRFAGMLLASSPWPTRALTLLPVLLDGDSRLPVESRFGKNTIRSYSGTINWTWNTGSHIETAEVTVKNGKAHCLVSYQSPEGKFTASGDGLIDLFLGLDPDEEAPAAQQKGKWYSFRVACPSAAPNAHPGASWSHSQDSYKQPGGEVGIDPRTGRIMVPKELKGGWTESTEDGSEHTSMRWHLCRGGCPVPPPENHP